MYARLQKVFQRQKLAQIADVVLVAASGYLLVKKAFDFSISGWLLNNALQQTAVDFYVVFSAILLIAAILIKIITILFDAFPATNHKVVEPEEISECLQVMNNEIMAHISKCAPDLKQKIQKLPEQHSFSVNTRMVTDALAEHIRRSVKSIKIKRKDLFISLYTFDETNGVLAYELHFDPKRDLVRTRRIDLNDPTFDDYESVKCMKSTNSTTYCLDKKSYAKGNSKRHKTLQHFMGCKLEVDETVFGFLNIEFHNNEVFKDEEQMQDFMEENIFPFKLLLEYQYLKARFFSTFSRFGDYWEAQ